MLFVVMLLSILSPFVISLVVHLAVISSLQGSLQAPALQKELEELKARHETALVIIGERNERVRSERVRYPH